MTKTNNFPIGLTKMTKGIGDMTNIKKNINLDFSYLSKQIKKMVSPVMNPSFQIMVKSLPKMVNITQNIVSQQIRYYSTSGWLIFDIVTDDLALEYLDIKDQENTGDEEYDLDDMVMWVIKNRKINDITKKIAQLGLVNGVEFLPKMIDILKNDDKSYKLLFQYIFSLIDATLLYQRERYDNLHLKNLDNYNSQRAVKKYSSAIELYASKLEIDKFFLGLKATETFSFLYDRFYAQKNKTNFRNSLMHGSINYSELTEITFYQLLVLLYQLTVNDEFYQFEPTN